MFIELYVYIEVVGGLVASWQTSKRGPRKTGLNPDRSDHDSRKEIPQHAMNMLSSHKQHVALDLK